VTRGMPAENTRPYCCERRQPTLLSPIAASQPVADCQTHNPLRYLAFRTQATVAVAYAAGLRRSWIKAAALRAAALAPSVRPWGPTRRGAAGRLRRTCLCLHDCRHAYAGTCCGAAARHNHCRAAAHSGAPHLAWLNGRCPELRAVRGRIRTTA
jgi:hypothetical protein